MPEHAVIKPQKWAQASVEILEQELTLPNLFTKKSISEFKGADDDTINMKVEGVLPWRTYGWRNDRTNPIQFDLYAERKIAISFGGDIYSAVKVTDEQMAMDLDGWSKLLGVQCRAVGRGLQNMAVDKLVNAPYQVVVGNAEQDLFGAILEGRRVLNSFHVPSAARRIIVGTEFEMELLRDKRITLAQNSGDRIADSALANATIGSIGGATVVVDPTIPGDEAYMIDGSGYVFISGAPAVPNGVAFGATASFKDIALRWICDYESDRLQDRSVVNTFAGFDYVKDPLMGTDQNNQEFVSATEYFVRGVKLKLSGANVYPADGSELARITGVSALKPWAPSTP